MEQYGGYTTIRYRACFGAILFLFFRKETPPPSPTHPPPPKKMLFKFQKFAYILRNGKRMTILLWGVWSYFGKQQRSLLKGSPRWKAWPENLKMTRVWKQWAISWSGCRGCSFFFFFFKVVLLFKVLGNVKQYRNFWYLKSEAVFAWAEPYVLHWSAADHHFGHLTARHEHRTANTHRPKVRSETLERVTTMQDPMKEILLIGRY